MQNYQNFYPMNNGYVQNPYAERMNFLQNCQQNLQPPMQNSQMQATSQQTSFIGKVVDSIDVVKATDIPMDGNIYYFPKADGRFAPKGRGTYRRGYDEPYYHMTPEMYREHDPEWYRDMDKNRDGLMYYTDTGMDKNMKMRDSREGRSGMSRMSYMESKEMHKADTPADKQYKMKELEKYMGELSKDITEMIADSSQEEKNLLKTKMQTLLQKF